MFTSEDRTMDNLADGLLAATGNHTGITEIDKASKEARNQLLDICLNEWKLMGKRFIDQLQFKARLELCYLINRSLKSELELELPEDFDLMRLNDSDLWDLNYLIQSFIDDYRSIATAQHKDLRNIESSWQELQKFLAY